MNKILKAVLKSNAFDILGTLVVIFLLGLILPLFGVNPVDVPKSILMTIGGLVSIAAGYYAASLAQEKPVLMGALSSILCVLGGLYVAVGAENVLKATALAFSSTLLGIIGGYIYLKFSQQ
jgi:hypothetical protein